MGVSKIIVVITLITIDNLLPNYVHWLGGRKQCQETVCTCVAKVVVDCTMGREGVDASCAMRGSGELPVRLKLNAQGWVGSLATSN